MNSVTIRQMRVPNSRVSNAMLSLAMTFFAFFALVVTSDAIQAPSWFDGRPYGFGFGYDYLEDPLSSLVIVGMFAVPLAIWHGFDLVSRDGEEGNRFHLLESFGPVISTFLGGMIGTAIILSGFTEWLSCWRPGPVVTTQSSNSFGFLCTPQIGYLIEYIVFPFFLVLVLLTVLKAVLVLRRKIA